MEKNTKQSNSLPSYEESMNSWFEDEKAGNEFIAVLGRLFYDKSTELIFFRTQLIDRSASIILYKHSFTATYIGKKLCIHDTLKLAKAICELDLPHTKIDIGRLNQEWTEQQGEFNGDVKLFLKEKLKHIIGQPPKFEKPADVVLFGFGRIGRLLLRELIIQGNGSQLRPKAIVTRKVTAEDIAKRASLIRHDSIHGPFRGNVIEDVENKCIHINGHVIKMLEGNNPEDIDYESHGINDAILIDNTGVFRDREALGRHLKAKGIKKVILTPS